MSLEPIAPRPGYILDKSPNVILREGASLMRRFARPVSESSEMDTLADVCERSTPGHYIAYAQKCLEGVVHQAIGGLSPRQRRRWNFGLRC